MGEGFFLAYINPQPYHDIKNVWGEGGGGGRLSRAYMSLQPYLQ